LNGRNEACAPSTVAGKLMSHGGVSAVNEIVPAGHERRLVGEQKAHQWCHFLGPPEPAKWMLRDERCLHVAGNGREQRGLDIRGADAIDAKSLRSVLGRGVLGESDDTVLGRRVGAMPMAATAPWIDAILTMAHSCAPVLSMAGI